MGIAEQDIIRNTIERLGQSRVERTAPELDVHFAEADDRTTVELLEYAARLARRINYFRDDIDKPAGDWTPFFPDEDRKIRELVANTDGTTPPHHALFLAFLELYQHPREMMNRITGRHLDFYYRNVLQLEKRPPQPDRAHLVVELKKGVPPLAIEPEHRFTAGKDAGGREILYAPTGTTVVNHAQVTELLSTFVDSVVRAGAPPVAATGEGRHAFGSSSLEAADIGFAISSPALLMKGGERTVTVTLGFERKPKESLEDAFDVFVTGEKGWIPAETKPQDDGNTLCFSLSDKAGSVVPYSRSLHVQRLDTEDPVALFLLKQSPGRYAEFDRVTLSGVTLQVEVKNLKPDAISTETGTADPKKPFLPFGSQPAKGARFGVGCSEALDKELAALDVTIRWKGLPNLGELYTGYGKTVTASDFTAAVTFADGGDWVVTGTTKSLFDTVNGSDTERTFPFERDRKKDNTDHGEKEKHSHFGHSTKKIKRPASRPGQDDGITITLKNDFFHALYRQKYIEAVGNFAKAGAGATLTVPTEPYTPAIESLTIRYETVPLPAFPAGKESDTVLHHVGPFGTAAVTGTRGTLLPDLPAEGELAIGLAPLAPGDSVSLLFQVAEGSGDPEAKFEGIAWSALCGDRWQNLDNEAITRDITNGLRTSGIVTFAIPTAATLDHTLMPPGMIWLRGRRGAGAADADLLVEVAANAVEVVWQPAAESAEHLATALPPGKIVKMKTPLSGVKAVRQPYSSFGGRGEESNSSFHTRVSERLRHRNRCISPWDFERIVLEEFPKIHRVKCIPHAKPGSYLAPGHTLLIVIPDLRNRSGVNRLQPRLDAATRDLIKAAVMKRAGLGIDIHVENPGYRTVALDFAVRFNRPDFNYWKTVLHEELVRFLSPWAFDNASEMTFGGTITKSELIDFIEELEYIDFVTEVVMDCGAGDVNEATPRMPDEIIVSAEKHMIREVKP